MEQIFQIFEALKGIIVRALPTFVLVILLHWYLKKMLFQPVERVLEERRKKTMGAIEDSEASLAKVNEKLARYEQAISDARVSIYQEQEAARKSLADQQVASVEAARVKSAERVAQVKSELAAEVSSAKAALASEADRLADEIAGVILAGKGR
jgi:F-type H+-transporting ATPase subunit b